MPARPSPSAHLARVVLVAAATAGLAACSLVTDLGGLTGGADAAFVERDATEQVSGDGGGDLDGGGGSGSDAGRDDAQAADAVAPGDAGQRDAGGDGARPCSSYGTAVLLCDDFERIALNGADLYTSVTFPAADAGTLRIEALPGSSGRALHVALPALPAGHDGQDEPHLRFVVPRPVTRFRLGYDLAIRTTNSVSRQIMNLRIDATDQALGGRIYLAWREGVLSLVRQTEGGGTVGEPLAPAPPLGTWVRWELTVDLAARTLKATRNGVLAAESPLSTGFSPSTFSLSVGFRFATLPSDPLDVLIDNVVVEELF